MANKPVSTPLVADAARFWAIDLHVHTPASRDVMSQQYGEASPEDVVRAALDAGLHAVAITDHNTADWCEAVASAASTTSLIVLPGIEITTTEGHLLAIWEEGTPARQLEDCLTKLDIEGEDRGQLDINASRGIAEAAEIISKCGGLAIAAHADAPKGLLGLPVASHVKKTLLTEALCAVELVDATKAEAVQRKVGDERELAFVRGSDAMVSGENGHRLRGIGARRTWLKASRPDLVGLRHAFDDPRLRLRLDDPGSHPSHPHILSVSITGGFLDLLELPLSPDLNCLVGGTGAGKSLTLECIRYALDQQTDSEAFPQIAEEVRRRLREAFGVNSTVSVTVVGLDDNEYVIERSFDDRSTTPCLVRQRLEDGDLVNLSAHPREVFTVSAFSQGEALEYSRHSVGRMALVDAGCDLSGVVRTLADLATALRANGEKLLDQRAAVDALRSRVTRESELATQIDQLEQLFDTQVVKDQKAWQRDDAALKKILAAIPKPGDLILEIAGVVASAKVESNESLLSEASAQVDAVIAAVSEAVASADVAFVEAGAKAEDIRARWNDRYESFKSELQKTLSAAPGPQSLVALKVTLERLQGEQMALIEDQRTLAEESEPALLALQSERASLIKQLMETRARRRTVRRERVKILNDRMSGIVKLDVPAAGDRTSFLDLLKQLKVGSRIREEKLTSIAQRIHPAQFAEAMLEDSYMALVDDDAGIDLESLSRLFVNIADKDLWAELLELQVLDTPDELSVKFKREAGDYVPVESLAHGQRCTAMLITLIADGNDPVIVDQPEDALHAPWIEEHLVDRLRDLRGGRQYLFATRSPGLVISADAEQIVTLKATAGRGEVEARGSLERHDLNKLVLHHLEGGPVPFRRRGRKLSASVTGT